MTEQQVSTTTGAGAALPEPAVQDLKSRLRGPLIRAGDPSYDAARKVYNGMIDKRPRLIARCVDVADVIAAVNFGREQGLPDRHPRRRPQRPRARQLRRRAGDRPLDDEEACASIRRAQTVRVEAGCTSGDVDHATHAFGLAVPFGIVSTTGVARPDARRGHGLPHAQVRPDDRQPARSRCRPGRRHACHRQQARARRSLLGAARRRRQLWRRDELPVPGASGRTRSTRARSSGRRRTRRR